MQYDEEFDCEGVIITIKEANIGNWKSLVKEKGSGEKKDRISVSYDSQCGKMYINVMSAQKKA